MYDAINEKVGNIPTDAQAVAGYDNGEWAWSDADWQRFSTPVQVHISVYIPGQSPPNRSHVLDVETSDASSPVAQQEAALWSFRRRQAGIVPSLYTSKDGYDYLSHIDCDWWLADPTNEPHILPGCMATQYASPGPYDLSLITEGWPRKVAPMPTAPIFKFQATASGKGYWIVLSDFNLYAYGDAFFDGHPTNVPGAIHDFIVTPTGQGYWFVDADANVYAYGDAPFLGHP